MILELLYWLVLISVGLLSLMYVTWLVLLFSLMRHSMVRQSVLNIPRDVPRFRDKLQLVALMPVLTLFIYPALRVSVRE